MNNLSKHRTFYIWFISYIAVLTLPLLFSLFNYFYSLDIIRTESQFHKKTTQNQMKDIVDFKLTEIKKMTDQIIWDRQIRFYLKLGASDQGFRDTVEKKIKEIRFLNKYIDQIYIVNEKKDISTGERIIPFNFQSTGIDWKKISANRKKSFSFEDVNSSIEGDELYFITRFFMIGEGKTDLYLVVFINPELLSESIMQIEWIENGAGFVLDSDAAILSSVVNIDLKESFKEDAAEFIEKHRDMREYLEIEKDNHIISLVKSDVVDWFYAIILPESIYYGKITEFQNIVFVSLFICLIAGIFLSLMFTRKNYLPVLDLVNLFSEGNFKQIYQNYINEFDILETEIKSVISENISIKETFTKNRTGLKRLFLRRLIMGDEIDGTIVPDIGNNFGISFKYENFAVMIITPADDESLSFFSLKNELDKKADILEKDHLGYLLAYSGRNVIILNIEDKDDFNAFNSRLEAVSAFLREESSEKFNITAGRIYDTLAGISMSYSEALQVLEYTTLLGDRETLLFSELVKLKTGRKFRYLSYLEDEYKIYNLLTAGKYEEAKNLLEGSMDSIEENYLDVEILKIRLAGFQNIFIEALNTILRNDRANLKALVRRIIETRSFLQFRKVSDSVLSTLSVLFPEKGRSEIVSSAKKYIEKNYNSKDLSVTEIAEKLGITTQHLSRIFKEINGTGLLQYINICRIEEAKKIMTDETDINVKDAANIVGYYNEITFIRNFKNITGLSPGKYRETMTKGE